MQKKIFYGFEGFYKDRVLDFELPSISEQEICAFDANGEGFFITQDAPVAITVVKINSSTRNTARIDISSACEKGKRVCLRIVRSKPPKLFAYTDKNHSGSFLLPL